MVSSRSQDPTQASSLQTLAFLSSGTHTYAQIHTQEILLVWV